MSKLERPSTDHPGGIGHRVARFEDARLVTGRGQFVDDINPPGCLHLSFLRSAYAHGRIATLSLAPALEAPGVIATFSGDDLASLGAAAVNAVLPGVSQSYFRPLATGTVEAVGQPLAAVIAKTAPQAADAVNLIALDIDPDTTQPIDEPTIAHQWTQGDVEAAFKNAAVIADVTVRHARVAPFALEPRAALANWDHRTRTLTVWLSTQTPHRARQDLARILDLTEEHIRVIAPDVGGAFGGKASIYPEEAMVAYAAYRLQRPVKWCAARSEDMLAASHGRGATSTGQLAFDASGRALALRAKLAFPLGHWLPYSAFMPARNGGRILPGPYRIDAVAIAIAAQRSNTAAMNIYRGAGRPEAAMLMERLMDDGARRLGLDPISIRKRNLLPASAFPHTTPTGEVLDSGDYPTLLVKTVAQSDYPQLRKQQTQQRRRGALTGIGVAFYVEPCGHGWESATVGLDSDGRIVAATGTSAQGQGRETSYAQIVADTLRVPLTQIAVRHGDTARTPAGIGALASRSTPIGGSALLLATRGFAAKAHELAARLLQCATDEIAAADTGFARLDDPGAQVSWKALADAADERDRAGLGLASHVVYHADGEAWSYGCCLARVAIDPDTGVLTVEHIDWVDDAGLVINPTLAEGQLIGGMAQGLGEALLERIVYDGEGQLITGSLMDYGLPKATMIPPLRRGEMQTPARANPLGAKGVGESGCIGIPAAVVNAAIDALAPYGVTQLDMPLNPETIWRALQNSTFPRPITPPGEPR